MNTRIKGPTKALIDEATILKLEHGSKDIKFFAHSVIDVITNQHNEIERLKTILTSKGIKC